MKTTRTRRAPQSYAIEIEELTKEKKKLVRELIILEDSIRYRDTVDDLVAALNHIDSQLKELKNKI